MDSKIIASIMAMLTSMFKMDNDSTVQEIQQRLTDEDSLIKAAVKDAQAETRLQVEGESEEQIEQLNARIAELEESNKTLTEQNDDLERLLANAQADIKLLKDEPGGEQAAGETDAVKGAKSKERHLTTGLNAVVQEKLNNKRENNPFAGW